MNKRCISQYFRVVNGRSGILLTYAVTVNIWCISVAAQEPEATTRSAVILAVHSLKMALDRYFALKCVVLCYAYIAVILGALMILGSIIVLANGQIAAGLQSIFSAVIFMAWAFLGYYGVTKKQRCQLMAFAIYLIVSFVISLVILALLPGEYGETQNNLQKILLERFGIQDDYKLKVFKILLAVEAFWKMFTSVCAFWLTHLIRIEQRSTVMHQVFKG